MSRVIIVFAFLAIIACGGGAAKADEATLRSNMNEVWTAFQKNDVSKLYALTLSDEAKKSCSLSDFTGQMLLVKALFGESFKNAKFTIDDVKIDGDKATYRSSLTLDGQPFGEDADDEPSEAIWNGKRWVDTDDSTCGDGDTAISLGSNTPTRAISPTPVTLRSTRETPSSTSLTSGGVTITVSRLSVADYKEYYAAQDTATKRTLDSTSDAAGALTIGHVDLKVENKNTSRISVYPDQATVVAGSEQVEIDFFSSDDVGGEYFPGVVKEGRVTFFLKRTPISQIGSVLYVVDSPFSAGSLGSNIPDFEFKLMVAPKNP